MSITFETPEIALRDVERLMGLIRAEAPELMSRILAAFPTFRRGGQRPARRRWIRGSP